MRNIHKFNTEEDKYITDNYSTMTYKQMADNLNLTESQVKHRIQRHLNIKPSKLRKHYHNEQFFLDDSNDKFYILGLIAADGNLFNGYKNNYKVSISLHSDDIELLRDINSKICDTNIVTTRKNSKQAELTIYNEVIYREIKRYGIVENKSLSLMFPNNIPKKYIKHFIRGYFDGDGSISVSLQGNYKKLTIQFLGTNDFLCSISNIINTELGISIKNITNTRTKIKCLRYFTREASAVMEWLYDEKCTKLERKYNKFISYRNKLND